MDVFGIAKVAKPETSDLPVENEAADTVSQQGKAVVDEATTEVSPPVTQSREEPRLENVSAKPTAESKEKQESGEPAKEAQNPASSGRQASGLVRERFLKRVESFKAPLREEVVDIKQMRALAQSGTEFMLHVS